MKLGKEQIKDWIIFKLSYKRIWEKRHISETNLVKPYKEMKKNIIKQADILVKEGILVKFPHTGETHYHLNPRMGDKIKEIVRGYKP
ncbi:MAG: hypothetical protein COY38_03385 [Candidatus Aenigmarchaeota archaeon CG_4_10_14_0_8_um_filter_37_24]|nr:hypothetical protein [Candidatus Aenigmarchaeota archaeon]OIN88512.1 MAG: hypothetical protein AUJ50_00535 [Candidatus Aenigmarchaeota archaeon CG1_02_38_14]PIV68134.1 MAG: hypothetical protein COS07_05145 [Candidatus Aenigmarchaeota archaeon CG01_land_8_20_14_3_00_37_9]PIW41741.1 MAG: hypothetical protein COW21_00320 [Candidatus Aenigmarchaeota archaeon CG15_BIG_FIL_POST_REV_8_21_14_020_37_27]PIY36258.1 MAG: hypothetical protein COZ04_00980 [Candidatus Aenigmarchaeota archaeon CG_4_10_14_3_